MDNSDTAAVSYLPEIVKWSAILSLAGALSVILSGYGYQWNWWSYRIGLSLLIPLGTVVEPGLITLSTPFTLHSGS